MEMSASVVYCYQVELKRKSRGWLIQEHFGPARVDGDGLRLPKDRRFALVGSLATEAIAAWERGEVETGLGAGGMKGAIRRRLARLHAETFRRLIEGLPPSDSDQTTINELWKSPLQWLPVSARPDKIRMTYVMKRLSPYERFPESVAWVSLLHGLQARTLRTCRVCRSPFTDRRQRKLCDLHLWALRHMPQSKSKEWGLFKDRLRKKRLSPEELSRKLLAALADLQEKTLEEWVAKWGERAPQGRHRKPRTA